jgi:hypothetical protein
MTSLKCKEISSTEGDFSFRLEIESTSHEYWPLK